VKPGQLQNTILRLLSGNQPVAKKAPVPDKMNASLAKRFPLRVLLTDDNIINQKVASRLLKQMGYCADIANSGLEAIQALERKPYDLVFMDVQMPEMDGLEATRRIRELQQTPDAPAHFHQPISIVAMTANAMHGDREKCVAAGMDEYIPKPVRIEVLKKIVEEIGAKHAPTPEQAAPVSENSASTTKSVAATPASPAEATPELPPVDMGRLDEFSGGSETCFHELVGLYVTQTKDQIEDIKSLHQSGQSDQIARVAHSCAGASSTCGMTAIVPLLRRIEQAGNEGNLEIIEHCLQPLDQEFQRIKKYLDSNSSAASDKEPKEFAL